MIEQRYPNVNTSSLLGTPAYDEVISRHLSSDAGDTDQKPASKRDSERRKTQSTLHTIGNRLFYNFSV